MCSKSSCNEELKLGNSKFRDFSGKYGILRPNIEPKTLNHSNEHPPTCGMYAMTSQENLCPDLEPFRNGSNRVFASAGGKPGFSQKMDNLSVFKTTAWILSTKFGRMEGSRMLPCTCINTSLVDDNLRVYSKHALWTAELKPIPAGCNSVPVLTVDSQQPNLCRATIGNCGTPSMVKPAPDLKTSAAMPCSPALCAPVLVPFDEAWNGGW